MSLSFYSYFSPTFSYCVHTFILVFFKYFNPSFSYFFMCLWISVVCCHFCLIQNEHVHAYGINNVVFR